MASRKVDFALKVVSIATQIAQAMDDLDALAGVWTASGYATGGANPITDTDITGHDITAAQLAQFATFAVNFKKFMANQTPTTADYRSVINAFRDV